MTEASRLRRWIGGLVIGVLLIAWAYPSRADDTAASASLSVRIVYDADSCPVRAEVYLDETTDTISGFELVLLWNRPDVLRFETMTSPVDQPTTDDGANPSDTIATPNLVADSGLVRHWTYLEARGKKGHMAKVIGLAQLVDPNPKALIKPGEQGLLFELPLAMLPAATAPVERDSVSLEFQPQLSRLSNAQGTLIPDVRLRSTQVMVPVCR